MSTLTTPTTIERFAAMHLSQAGSDQSGGASQPRARRISSARSEVVASRKAWLFTLSYAIVMFVSGVTLGYLVRDHREVAIAQAVRDSARDPARLRIEYNLRQASLTEADKLQR